MLYDVEIEKVVRTLVTYQVEAENIGEAKVTAMELAEDDDPNAEYDVLNVFD